MTKFSISHTRDLAMTHGKSGKKVASERDPSDIGTVASQRPSLYIRELRSRSN